MKKTKKSELKVIFATERLTKWRFATLFLLLVCVWIVFTRWTETFEEILDFGWINDNPESVIEQKNQFVTPVWNDKNIHIKEYAEIVNEKLDKFATSVMEISAPYFEQNFYHEFKNCMQNISKF